MVTIVLIYNCRDLLFIYYPDGRGFHEYSQPSDKFHGRVSMSRMLFWLFPFNSVIVQLYYFVTFQIVMIYNTIVSILVVIVVLLVDQNCLLTC